jgi:hypothetical protein
MIHHFDGLDLLKPQQRAHGIHDPTGGKIGGANVRVQKLHHGPGMGKPSRTMRWWSMARMAAPLPTATSCWSGGRCCRAGKMVKPGNSRASFSRPPGRRPPNAIQTRSTSRPCKGQRMANSPLRLLASRAVPPERPGAPGRSRRFYRPGPLPAPGSRPGSAPGGAGGLPRPALRLNNRRRESPRLTP